MSDTVITVDSLSKAYKIGLRAQHGKTFREAFTDTLVSPVRRLKSIASGGNGSGAQDDTFWALKDVSFEVKRGEVVGIIGRNGAGKSTLLKVLSRITEPTSGQVRLRGRVASLLEVGTGFHPELTGRENIYLNGAILGMKRAEITRKFDEIVAFAEVEKFLDTPVKRYSSGMYVRLAFAVAAHLEPEILIVDEVLAVGDAEFQKKCLGKMQDVAKGEGRTVLFVSHNMAAVQTLCSSAILLRGGEILTHGAVTDAIAYYNGERSRRGGRIMDTLTGGHDPVRVALVKVNGQEGRDVQIDPGNHTIRVDISGCLLQAVRIEMEARIYDSSNVPLAFYSPGHEGGSVRTMPVGDFRICHSITLPHVNRGSYRMSLFLTDPGVCEWAAFSDAVILDHPGTPTASGWVFEYAKGAGWVFLSSSVPAHSASV